MSEKTSRTFTEPEHEAIVTEAVRREVAAATKTLEDENTTLKNRVDTLEAEKAAAEQARDDVAQEFEDFKAEIDRKAEAEGRKETRVAAVKEIAAVELPDTYFSDERVTRWAEMEDEQFNALLDDMAEQALSHLDDREVASVAELEGEARRMKIAELLSTKKELASKANGGNGKTPVVPETASFRGGKSPTDPSGDGSTMRQWLGARGHAVPAQN